MYQRLKNSIVVVTGASSGIGEACAHRFAASGAKLVLVARRQDRLNKVKSDIIHHYPDAKVHVQVADVTDAATVEKIPSNLPEPFQNVSVLVNNAGLALGLQRTWEAKLEDIHAMVDTNIKGVMYFLRAFVPGMRERSQGHIINMSSVAGTFRYPNGSVYCASKHGVEAITTVLRMELIDTPIRVTAINPGLVETEFSLVRFKGDADQAKKPYVGIQPLSGDDVADAVLYAASRPPHVQISQIEIMPTHQASPTHVHRKSD
eukprot:TRINITY_DN6388_c0_g1_i1.p1 TRINITY_DN6388_c0_g1~~TRINITY_DN6388_c0_g1_i1.p1  ORF type:complete len:261 (+),score=46.00 TRINITY_DN6388_c0_g1_i1:71-853(+)